MFWKSILLKCIFLASFGVFCASYVGETIDLVHDVALLFGSAQASPLTRSGACESASPHSPFSPR